MADTIVISNRMTDETIFYLPRFIRATLDTQHREYLEIFTNEELEVVSFDSPSIFPESFYPMLMSEDSLKKEWEDPIEDEAWADI